MKLNFWPFNRKKFPVEVKNPLKHTHTWEKLGGGGERDSGFVYKCTKCGAVGISD